MSVQTERIVDQSWALYDRSLDAIPMGTQTHSKAPRETLRGIEPCYIVRGKGCRRHAGHRQYGHAQGWAKQNRQLPHEYDHRLPQRGRARRHAQPQTHCGAGRRDLQWERLKTSEIIRNLALQKVPYFGYNRCRAETPNSPASSRISIQITCGGRTRLGKAEHKVMMEEKFHPRSPREGNRG